MRRFMDVVSAIGVFTLGPGVTTLVVTGEVVTE